MHTSHRGLAMIESFEGFSAVQYDDGTGTMTIGYGTTAADISPLPTRCTRAQAEGWLAVHLQSKYEPSVNQLGVSLNQNQFDALVSLAYNVGPAVFGDSIGQHLHARSFQAASADFMLYVHAGGRVLQGLVNRRRAERQLFDTPWVPADPHHYLWFDNTLRAFGRERRLVIEYDRWRAQQTSHKHPHRLRLGWLRFRLRLAAGRLRRLGQLALFHRGWRRRELELRASGHRVV